MADVLNCINSALAKTGVKVLHVDPNSYYGAAEASLTTDELRTWVDGVNSGTHPGFSSASVSGEAEGLSRSYALSLTPSIIPSIGQFINALIESGVSRYGGFKLLENISLYSSGNFKRVPASKEEIFRSKDLSLLDKRKLMRFLTFAASDSEISKEHEEALNAKTFPDFLQDIFSIDRNMALILTYAFAFCESESGSQSMLTSRRFPQLSDAQNSQLLLCNG